MSSSVPGHVRSAVGRASARVRNRHRWVVRSRAAPHPPHRVAGRHRPDRRVHRARHRPAPRRLRPRRLALGPVRERRARRLRRAPTPPTAPRSTSRPWPPTPPSCVAGQRPAGPGRRRRGRRRLPEGTRLRLFVEVASPSGYVRPLGRVVAWSADGEVAGSDDPSEGARYRDPLGQYETTDVPRFDTVEHRAGAGHPVRQLQGHPLGARRGTDAAGQPGAQRRPQRGPRACSSLRGALLSRHVELSSASLIIQGRTSGYQAVVPAPISFDAEATRSGFGPAQLLVHRDARLRARPRDRPDQGRRGRHVRRVRPRRRQRALQAAGGAQPDARAGPHPRWPRHARRHHALDRAVLHVQGEEPVAAPGDLRRRGARAPAPPALDRHAR